jgi:hypothetical protein
MQTNLERFKETQRILLVTAVTERNHLLDRIDAYLELAQLHEKDAQRRAEFVRRARDLIAKDL